MAEKETVLHYIRLETLLNLAREHNSANARSAIRAYARMVRSAPKDMIIRVVAVEATFTIVLEKRTIASLPFSWNDSCPREPSPMKVLPQAA